MIRRAIAALATSAVLAGCGVATMPQPGPPVGTPPAATSTATATFVMVIRHAEKPEGKGEQGVDAQGREDESSLTRTGWDRAHRLVDLFSNPNRPGLARPTTIYAARANDEGEGQRTRETVQPLAEQLAIPADTSYGKGDEQALIKHVIAQAGPALISWQHSKLPDIAEQFPNVTPAPPSEWPEDRYDIVWTFTKTTNGWHFAQVPELVLPQDQADVIED